MVAKGTKRKGNYPTAKYVYLNGDKKHPYEWKACPVCGLETYIQTRRETCSYKCAKTGKRNPLWNPTSIYNTMPRSTVVGYHRAVYKEFGNASEYKCIACPEQAHDWANQTGHYDDINDFEPMCISCHRRFDWQRSKES